MSSIPPFLFGSATSSHQVEGDNKYNDWWHFETQGLLKDPSGKACNQYELYEQDFDLIKELGHNAHRLSLEWSRLEPSEGNWSEEAFDHYKKVFEALRLRGIEPVVTLNHFTIPNWFLEKGGWTKTENSELFLIYVRKVVAAYKEYVRYWVTFNEPMVYVNFSYFEGLWPPKKKSFSLALKVIKNLLKAHIKSYEAIHQIYDEKEQKVFVSISKHMMKFVPLRKNSIGDHLSVFFRDWFFNHLFSDALWKGFLFFPFIYCEKLPASKTLDYLGFNFYSRQHVRFRGLSATDLMGDTIVVPEVEKNQLGWEVVPEAFYDMLMSLKKFRLPVFILENGICTLDDKQREKYIRSHTHQVERAMQDGLNVRSYFYWSLLDNFEWAEGYEPRFGIVEVNFENQERKVRPSAQVLTECCRKLLSGY